MRGTLKNASGAGYNIFLATGDIFDESMHNVLQNAGNMHIEFSADPRNENKLKNKYQR